MQAMQALIPRQEVLVPTSQEGVQVVQAIIPRKVALILSPGGVQAVLIPQLGRSTGSAGAHSHAGSTNPQPKRSAGNAGTHSQAGSTNPPARKECRQCRCSFPRRPESQSQPRCLWCYSRGCHFFPRQYIRYHWEQELRPGGFILKF